jgi:hypothetical protein
VMERYRPVDIFYYDEISVESPYKWHYTINIKLGSMDWSFRTSLEKILTCTIMNLMPIATLNIVCIPHPYAIYLWQLQAKAKFSVNCWLSNSQQYPNYMFQLINTFTQECNAQMRKLEGITKTWQLVTLASIIFHSFHHMSELDAHLEFKILSILHDKFKMGQDSTRLSTCAKKASMSTSKSILLTWLMPKAITQIYKK